MGGIFTPSVASSSRTPALFLACRSCYCTLCPPMRRLFVVRRDRTRTLKLNTRNRWILRLSCKPSFCCILYNDTTVHIMGPSVSLTRSFRNVLVAYCTRPTYFFECTELPAVWYTLSSWGFTLDGSPQNACVLLYMLRQPLPETQGTANCLVRYCCG